MQPELPAQVIVLPPAEVEQAPLFDSFDCGAELLSIEEDAASGKHNAVTLAKRTELRDELAEMLCRGMSIRNLAKRYRVSRNTLARLIVRLEAAGKMEPLKKRLAGKLGAVAELSADVLLERLENDDLPPNVLPIAMGVAMDKKDMIEARAGVDDGEVDAGLTVEQVNAAVAALNGESGKPDAK